MSRDPYKIILTVSIYLGVLCPGIASAQSGVINDTLAGADKGEHAPEEQPHFFGDWNGERKKLLQRGFNFNLEYVSDSLWNVQSVQKERLALFERARGTVDLDFGRLAGIHGLFLQLAAIARRQNSQMSTASCSRRGQSGWEVFCVSSSV